MGCSHRTWQEQCMPSLRTTSIHPPAPSASSPWGSSMGWDSHPLQPGWHSWACIHVFREKCSTNLQWLWCWFFIPLAYLYLLFCFTLGVFLLLLSFFFAVFLSVARWSRRGNILFELLLRKAYLKLERHVKGLKDHRRDDHKDPDVHSKSFSM